ncbi:MAG: hypothetical protein WDZ49_17150, partial [Litorilinea sp.]
DATATPEPEDEADDADDADDATDDVDADATATPEPEEEADDADDADDAADADDTDEFLTSITLPDGIVCLHAGRGATLAFDEQRVNYSCEGEAEGVLLGEMSTQLDLLVVTYGVLVEGDDGMELDSSEEIELRMAEVTLADGTVCRNAGQGATAAFDEGRVNFTCEGADNEEWVVLGDMTVDMDVLTATLAQLADGDDGLEVGDSVTAAVVEVVGEEVEE